VERAGDSGAILLATPPQVKVRHKHTHNLKERLMLKAKEGHTLKGKVGRLRVNLGMVHSRSAVPLSLSLYLYRAFVHTHKHTHTHTHRAMDLRVSTPPPPAPLGKGRVESGGSGMLSRLS
jgi:hypothetical protein